jgi:hypothetical protein
MVVLSRAGCTNPKLLRPVAVYDVEVTNVSFTTQQNYTAILLIPTANKSLVENHHVTLKLTQNQVFKTS